MPVISTLYQVWPNNLTGIFGNSLDFELISVTFGVKETLVVDFMLVTSFRYEILNLYMINTIL